MSENESKANKGPAPLGAKRREQNRREFLRSAGLTVGVVGAAAPDANRT